MVIKDLKIDKQPKSNAQRCERFVSKHYTWRNGKCQRFAMFNIDGIHYCRQHAGDEALNYFLLNNGKDND